MHAWTALAPLPSALSLSKGYDRHTGDDAAVRSELLQLAASTPWAGLPWPQLLTALIAAGRTDIGLSKLLESHVDALRILVQAGAEPEPGALYGVWASRSERSGVRARIAGTELILDGTVRFASGSGVLDRVLLPVWLDTETHQLIDLALPRDGSTSAPSLTLDTSSWATSAMEVSRSHTWTLTQHPVPATSSVGAVNFYLSRPGFFPGGIGVAACWLGGAVRVADLAAARMREPVPASLQQRLGAVRSALASGASALEAAGRRLSDSDANSDPEHGDGRQLSTEARSVVAAAVHTVLDEAHRIAGPAGLAHDLHFSRAVHDLRLYVLQANEDADAAYLGGLSTD